MKKNPPNYKHPSWQQKRLEIMNRDNFQCCLCGDKDTMLNVHHRYYISGRDPWVYCDFALQTLCETCHAKEHEKVREYPSCVEEWEHVLEFLTGGDPKGLGKVLHSFAATVNHLVFRDGVTATQAWLESVAFERAGFPTEHLESQSSQNS